MIESKVYEFSLQGEEFWAAYAAVAIAIYLMLSIGRMGMFRKAGEKRWKAWVPVLNRYTEYKISWSGAAFWVYLVLSAAAGILSYHGSAITSFLYSEYALMGAGLATTVIQIIDDVKVSKSFGHGGGFAILLILFPEICKLTLALGNSEYVGREGKKADGQ